MVGLHACARKQMKEERSRVMYTSISVYVRQLETHTHIYHRHTVSLSNIHAHTHTHIYKHFHDVIRCARAHRELEGAQDAVVEGASDLLGGDVAALLCAYGCVVEWCIVGEMDGWVDELCVSNGSEGRVCLSMRVFLCTWRRARAQCPKATGEWSACIVIKNIQGGGGKGTVSVTEF